MGYLKTGGGGAREGGSFIFIGCLKTGGGGAGRGFERTP